MSRPKRKSPSFWITPGRSDIWWKNILNGISAPEEWKENFRLTKDSFFDLCEELRPFLTKISTRLREPIPVEKQVAVTLYYLAEEGFKFFRYW